MRKPLSIMADRTSRLAAALTAEFIIRSEFKSSSVSEELTASRQQQIVQLQAIKNSASLSDILIAEKTILAFELHHYANTATMKSSITAALADIAIAEQLAAVIVDPAAYKAVDQSHSRPKNRANHLPLDEARQFFRSHSTRLLNLDKGRLDRIDKKIIDARRANMRIAEKAYIGLQQVALGITPKPPKRGQGRGLEM